MKNWPKISLEFLKNNKQLVFSILVVILVPALVVLNTVLFINRNEKVLDLEFQDKAIMAAQGLNASMLDSIGNREGMKKEIADYANLTEHIYKIQIIEQDGQNGFKIASSLSEGDIGKKIELEETKKLYALAWYAKDPYAKLIYATENEKVGKNEIKSGAVFWSVVTPVVNRAGNRVYLADVWLSVERITEVQKDNTVNAIIISGIIILVIVVMIFANGQLFQYSILFSKLKEVDQMKDDFISIASHELRTPLTAIKGYLSMILEDLDEGKLSKNDKKEMIESAAQSADRLNELVADVLDVSRLEQGRMKIEPTRVNIVEVAKKVADGLSHEAKTKGLKLNQDYKESATYSNVDKAKLEQVLVNIIGNAVKYTPKGSVDIMIQTENSENHIMVKDTGIGINEEERKNLFSKFYRVQNDETKEITGTGLGLWITKEIVETMGGKIMVDSIKDVGTEFTITFPKVK
jgi:signal transduction histidine kinase